MRVFLCAAAAFLTVVCASAQNGFRYDWTLSPVNGSVTGVRSSGADDVEEAMGSVRGGRYYSPSGKVFRGGSVTRTAKIMLVVQPEMSEVKKVIAYSTEAMIRKKPECALSNWFIDVLMAECEALAGKKVDVGFTNFGGIRVDMPKGDVLLDDIMSMFPFKNNVCYLELEGRDIRVILETMARKGWQVIGGVRCTATKSGELLSAEIGGEPLDDDRIYGVATISFLLDGGDGLSIARNAKHLTIFDQYIIDVILPYVKKLTAEGKPIEYKADGRVKIVK
ncbi:MAG: 5'-nucleotidase C-terminal domain-containing protein [Candidatus Cryptobacteroides sp.]